MMPGLGQVYVGYYKHGFVIMGVFALVISLLAAIEGESSGLAPLMGTFLPFFYFYNIIDAIRKAKIYNQVIDGISQAKLPEDLQFSGFAGSLAGGLVLIFVGLLALLHTLFGMSLAWLADWWPLFLVVMGVYLVYKDIQDKGPEHPLFGILRSRSTTLDKDETAA